MRAILLACKTVPGTIFLPTNKRKEGDPINRKRQGSLYGLSHNGRIGFSTKLKLSGSQNWLLRLASLAKLVYITVPV